MEKVPPENVGTLNVGAEVVETLFVAQTAMIKIGSAALVENDGDVTANVKALPVVFNVAGQLAGVPAAHAVVSREIAAKARSGASSIAPISSARISSLST